MKIGKLNQQDLQRLVFDHLPPVAANIAGPATGLDCAAIRFGDGQVVLTTDPITGASENIGWLAVHVACNDIACCGIRPSAMMMVIVAPPTTEPAELAAVVDQAAGAARNLSVSIIGGHTEISDAVNRIMITSTALGFTYGRQIIQASGGKPGDTLIMSKTAGLEGTAILAAEQKNKLIGYLSDEELEAACNLINAISVVDEGSCGGSLDVHAMHDATEGGVLGACWEMAEASGTGILIDQDAITLHPLTKRICQVLAINPYRLIASGCMLMATPEPDRLTAELTTRGIPCAAIGTLTENMDKLIQNEGKTAKMAPPESDELYKIN